jgi:hypothetical protein
MPRRVNVVESVKRYITGNGARTTSELHVKVVAELKQPVKISLLRYVLRRLKKKGVVKSENLLFTKSLLWSLNLGKKEIEDLRSALLKV